jgi:HSP20 family molecular chaperone IbpA
MMDMDLWHRPAHFGDGPSTLEIFDPFDELDRLMGRNLQWLNKPDFLESALVPRVPDKYRITLDVTGYNPASIKTEFVNGKLVISGAEGEKLSTGDDYTIKEFKKSYKLPENAEYEKLVSFVTSNGVLVVEVPLKNTETQIQKLLSQNFDLMPRIVENKDGSKQVAMNMSLPESIDPAKITVTCKDRDVIIKAQDKSEVHEKNRDTVSSVYFYKRTTLPENTDFEHLKCNFDNHKLSIGAPLIHDYHPHHVKKIPVEYPGKKHAIQGSTGIQGQKI